MNNAFNVILAKEEIDMIQELASDDSLDNAMDTLMNFDEMEDNNNE